MSNIQQPTDSLVYARSHIFLNKINTSI